MNHKYDYTGHKFEIVQGKRLKDTTSIIILNSWMRNLHGKEIIGSYQSHNEWEKDYIARGDNNET